MSDTSIQRQGVQELVSPSVTASPKPASRWRLDLIGWGFILPLLIVYVIFLLWPILLGLRMSFFNWSLVGSGTNEFLGFGNYAEALRDSNFWGSLWNTIVFTVISTPILVILSLVLALMVNSVSRRVQWIYRLAFFAPYTLSVTVMALIWSWMFEPGFGLLNGVLTSLGLPSINWLTQPGVAMLSIVLVTVWWTLGFDFLLYMAGLQQISKDVYEASALDGAGWWNRTFYITIPLLNRQTMLVLILQVIASLQLFGQTYLLTGGGPNFSTRPVIEYIYDSGFTNMRVGFAAATSYLFFIFILLISLGQFWFLSRQGRNS
jgi:multiple sugar transport system permease protein